MATEPLANSVRNNKEIKGIKVNNEEIKISLFADDTVCFVENTHSINIVLNSLYKFQEISGLKINNHKTQCIGIGSERNKKYSSINLNWTDINIQTLGITITNTESKHYEVNYLPKMNKIKNLLQLWKQRTLSLKGKITVLNTLALPIILYCCTMIHTPRKILNKLKTIINSFYGKERQKLPTINYAAPSIKED